MIWDETLVEEFKKSLLDDIESLNNIVSSMSDNSVDSSVSSFTLYITKNAQKHFSRRKQQNNKRHHTTFSHQKWFNKDCKNAKREFSMARNKFLRNKCERNKIQFLDKKRIYNRLKRQTKNHFKKQEGERISQLAKDKPKDFWKKIKYQYKHEISSPEIDINELYEHFNNLFASPNTHHNDNLNNEDMSIVEDEDLDMEFTENEVRNAVFAQKSGKSPGTDKLVAEVFKSSFSIISPFLTKLYCKLFNDGIFPQNWEEGIIVPIFKGGKHEAKNFRGITLNNILSKIYSKLLVDRLIKWSDKHEKIIENQFGFQKNKSTIDCIFILHSIITKSLSQKKKLYVAFLDWEKMFDKIDRIYLWRKLTTENVSTKLTNALKSIYKSVKSFIRYHNIKSDHIHSYNGVKQGDPASSILCLFFLNDILNSVNNNNLNNIFEIDDLRIWILLFADDAAAFSHDPLSLQLILNDIEAYCNEWGLKLNAAKTKIMIFEKGRNTQHDFFIYGTKIDIVNSFKYLGVTLYKNGNWYRSQKYIAEHAAYSLHNLFIIYNQIDLPTHQKIRLFDTLVAPILNYAACIWGYHKSPDIENLHSKFCRKILYVKRSTNLNALYGELGRLPMSIQRKLLMIKYWIRILTLNRQSLLFKTYLMLKQDADNNYTYSQLNWAYQIKNILDTCGLSYSWHNQFNMLINYNTIKQRIIDIYCQTWYTSINNSTRLDTYCIFKHDFIYEPYLDFIKEKKYRVALSQFRTSSHRLEIETGRYQNIDRKDRICKNCNTGQIENEYHFLFICQK
jgi:hypothetical protein